MEVDTYVDGSGLNIYYTPNLRKYDSGGLALGQGSLAIPPGADTHYHTGYCTSKCTTDIGLEEQPVYFYKTGIHMHYLGYYDFFCQKKN